MSDLRSKLITAAAVGAAAVGGATIANAASSSNSSGSGSTASATGTPSPGDRDHHGGGGPGGPHTVNGVAEKPLTGDVEAKVKAAALAKVPGTVERVETNVDGDAPYEAHITKSDGTEVEVQVNKDFSVAAVNEMGGRHP